MADQVITVGDIPVGLSIVAMKAQLELSEVDPAEWRRLIEDARLMFERLVARPARDAAKRRNKSRR